MFQLDITKQLDAKRLMMAVAMVAFVVNSAWAAELAPKNDVTLTADNLTVGDVFPGADHDASYVLAPAPGYGQTLTLNARDLQRVSDAFSLGWSPISGHEQTIVHRSSHDVDRFAIEGAVGKELSSAMKGQKFDIELSDRNMSFHIPEDQAATVEADNVRYDLAAGTFSAVIVAPAGSLHPFVKQEISGKLFPLVAVPVLHSAMRQGDMIGAADLDHVQVRSCNVASSTILEDSKLIGMSPRRGIMPLRPIAVSEIMPPLVVKKGDTVVMELKSGQMILTVQGKALENGAAGDTVRVENPTSNHVVQAVVTGDKSVEVAAPAVGNGT
jgi:flagellar basal body P-ring formation protein FlgA